jgi:hypothetical protein
MDVIVNHRLSAYMPNAIVHTMFLGCLGERASVSEFVNTENNFKF